MSLTLWIVQYADTTAPGSCTHGLQFGASEDEDSRSENALFATEREAIGHAEQHAACSVWEIFITKSAVLDFAREHHVHGPKAPAVCRYVFNGKTIEQETAQVRYCRGRFIIDA